MSASVRSAFARSSISLLVVVLMVVQGAPIPQSAPGPAGEAARSRAVDDWPQFHYDSARTGATGSAAPSANTTIWSFQTDGAVNGSVCVANGAVFAGSADGCLYALNWSTGALLWKAQTGGPVCTPAVAGSFVYAGSEDGSLHAFYMSNGTEAFAYASGAPVRSPVLVSGSSVIFGNDAGTVIALDLSGNLLWANSTGAAVRRAPAAGGNLVYVCSGNGLTAYSVADGDRVWNATAGSGNLSNPSFYQSDVFAGSEDGVLRAFGGAGGAPLWSVALSGAIVASAACSGGSLYVGTRGGRFHIVNSTSGAQSNVSTGGSVDSSAALSPEEAVLGTSAGVSALALNGSELWSHAVPGGVVSSPAISRGRVFVGTCAGAVLAFGFRHTAVMTSAGPGVVAQGTAVTFNGTSPDCAPVSFQWRSSLDGILSAEQAFTMSSLTLGYHVISFRIQDSNWTWSDWDSKPLEITPPSDWPMFRKDTGHTGVSNGEVPLTSTLVWSTHLGGHLYSSPVVFGGQVLIGQVSTDPQYEGAFYSLDLDTGAINWSYTDNNAAIDSTAACADGTVFMSDDAGNVAAFSAADHTILWSFKTNNIWGSPVVADGKVIVPSKGDARVLALDERTGVPVWTFALPDPLNSSIWSSPAVAAGLVLFGSNNHRFYAVDLQTGREVWNFSAKAGIRESSACVSNDTVFFGSEDWKLYALNLNNGTKKWEFSTAADISCTPMVYNGKVLFGSWDNKFRALDAETGQLLWFCQTGGPVHSSAAAGGGLVFFAAFDGTVYALNETTGEATWTYNNGSQLLRSSPALVAGRLYIGTENGDVLAFGKAPDLSTSAAEIGFTPPEPTAGQQMRITARVRNIGTLDATANARISDGDPGVEIAASPISVPAGGAVDLTGNWTVQPGIHAIWVSVTNTTPYEANTTNNRAGRQYIPAAESGWTMFKADPERTSDHDNMTAPNSNALGWSARTQDGVPASPVTAGTRLYQPAGDTLYAFDTRNGTLVWSHATGSPIFSTPAVSNLVVLGTLDGRILALNEWDGGLMWTVQTGGEVRSSPLIVSESVYVGSSDGFLYALSLYTGAELWRADLGGPVLSSPAYDPAADMLVVGSQNAGGQGRINCVYMLNGTGVWNRTVPAPVDSTPAIRQGARGSAAYIGCDDGSVYAMKVRPDGTDDGVLDPVNSTYDTLWASNLTSLVTGNDHRIQSSPAFDELRVYVGVGSNTLAALNITTGAMEWHRELGSPADGKYLRSSPALAENRLFVGADALYAVNARNGATVWSFAPGGWFWSSPAVSVESPASLRGTVYATSEDGFVCAFSKTVPIPPVAAISTPSEGQRFRTGETIFFEGSASWDPDGEVVNYSWSFGDGNFSYNATDVHVFLQSGSYNVSLTVRDDRGLEGSAFVDIAVRNNSAPRLGFPLVTPDGGDVSTLFGLKVTYYDADNDTARDIAAIAGGTAVPLDEVDPADTNTVDGKEFYCETALPSGVYGVYFEASDGVMLNRTPDAIAMTVTNRSVFSNAPINDTFVELFYAGLGGVHFTDSAVGAGPPDPLIPLLHFSPFLLSEHSIDRWWWANISVNFSALNLTGVNTSTMRIYWWNLTITNWTLAENAGIDLARKLVYANVTELGNFTVFGLPPANHAPVAKLSRHEMTITEGDTVTFNASGSYDPDTGDALKYSWDFGEGATGSGKIVEHKYNKAGRFTVILTVTDGKVNSTDTLVVTVKQKGGEQTVLILVVVILLVVGILFFLPRGDKKPEDRWNEQDEKFRKGMEARKPPGKDGKNGKNGENGKPSKIGGGAAAAAGEEE